MKGAGFLTDFDQFTPEQISRNAFYREFLQPVGYGWHACATLGDGARHEKLLLSLKRRHSHGHYQRRDIELLDTFLPMLRAAAECSRAVLDAEARGLGAAFEDRGDVVLSLDARGRLLRHGDADGRLAEWGLQIIGGHLVAARDEQPHLARAIAAALGAPPRAGRAVLCTGDPAVRLLINVVPVVGLARDVFHAASAVLAIGVWRKPDAAPHALVRLLSETFGLTRSEARVAALVSSGLSLRESALRLGISVGTARHYSKAVLQKTRTARQSELAALVGHLKF